MAEASARGGRGPPVGEGLLPSSPAVERSSPELRGPGSVACPAPSLARGPERLGNLPKLTQLQLPVAMSLRCYALGPQAEGPWLLLGAPMLGGKAVPFHPRAGVYTGIHNSRGNGQSSPGMEGSPGKAGSGRVRGSEGRRQGNAGPRGESGQGALWAWFRP